MKHKTLTVVGAMAFLISGCTWLFDHEPEQPEEPVAFVELGNEGDVDVDDATISPDMLNGWLASFPTDLAAEIGDDVADHQMDEGSVLVAFTISGCGEDSARLYEEDGALRARAVMSAGSEPPVCDMAEAYLAVFEVDRHRDVVLPRFAENQVLVESTVVFGQLEYGSVFEGVGNQGEDVEFVSFEEAVNWAESLAFITEEEKARFINGLRTASFPTDARFAVGYTAGCHFDDARLVFDGHFIFLDPFHSSGVVAQCIRAEPYAAVFVLEGDVEIPETLEAQ